MASRRKKRWSDLSTKQRGAVVALGIVQLSVQVAALADLRRRPAKQVNGRKAMWAALSFLNFIGPLAYFSFGRKR